MTFSMRRIAPVRNSFKAGSDMGCATRARRSRVKQADLRQAERAADRNFHVPAILPLPVTDLGLMQAERTDRSC